MLFVNKKKLESINFKYYIFEWIIKKQLSILFNLKILITSDNNDRGLDLQYFQNHLYDVIHYIKDVPNCGWVMDNGFYFSFTACVFFR